MSATSRLGEGALADGERTSWESLDAIGDIIHALRDGLLDQEGALAGHLSEVAVRCGQHVE